jgi:hypothetical protein
VNLRFWRRKRPPYNYLRSRTGMDEAEWVRWIQDRISSTWQPNPDDPKHPISWPADDWIIPLVEEVERRVLERMSGGDENIGIAQLLALILATWGGRIARAKSMDPHRPVELRQRAYTSWLRFVLHMQATLVDEARDPEYFEQPWESPYLPEATDGDFV